MKSTTKNVSMKKRMTTVKKGTKSTTSKRMTAKRVVNKYKKIKTTKKTGKKRIIGSLTPLKEIKYLIGF